ncbi:hypothetical protein HD554DRAFT_2078809 [Boletus coccyginus]|nr:hypothetical protein HD554DRAFT_2078809 [Boletus coccyginus]
MPALWRFVFLGGSLTKDARLGCPTSDVQRLKARRYLLTSVTISSDTRDAFLKLNWVLSTDSPLVQWVQTVSAGTAADTGQCHAPTSTGDQTVLCPEVYLDHINN